MRRYQNYKVWHKARAFLLRVDPLIKRIARGNPRLADQLRRAAESIPEAIAEGSGRATDRDFAHYVSIASGSASEIENLLQRLLDHRLINEAEHAALADDVIEIRKMLYGLHRKLKGE